MSDMTFTRVGTIKPENAHKFEMFESILAVLLKNEKKEKYDDAMTVLEWLMAHILFHLANRDEWHDEIEEVRRAMIYKYIWMIWCVGTKVGSSTRKV